VNVAFKIASLSAAPGGKVKALLKSNKWDPPAQLALTVSVTNDLVVGCKLGDIVEVTLKRKS
jgi:hypothetical protein